MEVLGTLGDPWLHLERFWRVLGAVIDPIGFDRFPGWAHNPEFAESWGRVGSLVGLNSLTLNSNCRTADAYQ